MARKWFVEVNFTPRTFSVYIYILSSQKRFLPTKFSNQKDIQKPSQEDKDENKTKAKKGMS